MYQHHAQVLEGALYDAQYQLDAFFGTDGPGADFTDSAAIGDLVHHLFDAAHYAQDLEQVAAGAHADLAAFIGGLNSMPL